jgi:GNAT superfamily N-acetyltransferase
METPIEIRRTDGDDPEASALIAAMEEEVIARFGPADSERTAAVAQGELSPPGGAYVVLSLDGRAVAGGGVRRLDDGLGEIKRMYVVADARKRGLGRVLLGALEEAAAELGYARVRLDTSTELPGTVGLYRSAGYRDIPDYNANEYADFWGEKRLTSPGRR